MAVTSVARGDAVVSHDAPVRPTRVLDAALALQQTAGPPARRVQVHHGTRAVAGRLIALTGRHWQLRLERPLLVADGDRVVIRRIAPPDTLGGGIVLASGARRPGADEAETATTAPDRRRRPRRDPRSVPALDADARAVAERLRAAGHEPPSRAQLGDDARHLEALRAAGLAVRVGRDMYAHVDAIGEVRERVSDIIRAEGAITLARLRDELHTSRRFAHALLEHLDADRLTRRRPDDSRVLRRGRPD